MAEEDAAGTQTPQQESDVKQQVGRKKARTESNGAVTGATVGEDLLLHNVDVATIINDDDDGGTSQPSQAESGGSACSGSEGTACMHTAGASDGPPAIENEGQDQQQQQQAVLSGRDAGKQRTRKPYMRDIQIVAEDGTRGIAYNVESTRPFWRLFDKYAKARGKDHRWQYDFVNTIDGVDEAVDSDSSMRDMDWDSGTTLKATFKPDFTYIRFLGNDKEFTVWTTKTNSFQYAFDVYAKEYSLQSRFLKFATGGKEIRGNSSMVSLELAMGEKIAVTKTKSIVGFTAGVDYDRQQSGGLPDELLSIALTSLSYLDSRTFILAAPLVCRRWYNVCQIAINVKIDTGFASVLRGNGIGPVMRNPLTDNALMYMADRFPLLQRLVLLNATRSCTDEHYQTVSSQLTIRGFVYMLKQCKRLKVLNLTGCKNADDSWMNAIAELAPSLETLDMTGCTVSISALQSFAAKSNTLKSLVLPRVVTQQKERASYGAAEATTSIVLTNVVKMTQLEVLDASQLRGRLDSSCMQELAASCPRLSKLLLGHLKMPTNADSVDGSSLEALGRFSNLRELKVEGDAVTKKALLSLSECMNLTSLSVNNNNANATEAFLEHFQIPSLKILNLNCGYSGSRFEDKHVAGMCAAFEGLVTLELEISGTVSDSESQGFTGEGLSLLKLAKLRVSSPCFTGEGTTLPSLTSLEVRDCPKLQLSGLEAMLKESQIEDLDISNNDQATNAWLAAVEKFGTGLRTLKMENLTNLDCEGMLAIVTLSDLEKLNMAGVKNIKAGPWLDRVKQGCWAKLKSLDLDGTTGKETRWRDGRGTTIVNGKEVTKRARKMVDVQGFVDDQWFESFAHGSNEMEEVSAHSNCLVTAETVWDLVNNCPLMKRVDFSGCTALNANPRFVGKMGNWPLLEKVELCGDDLCTWPGTFQNLAQCKKLKTIFVSPGFSSSRATSTSDQLFATVSRRHDTIREERIKDVDPTQLEKIGQHGWESVYPEPEQSIRAAEDKARDSDPQMIVARKLNEDEEKVNELLWDATLKLFPPGVLQSRCSCCHHRGSPDGF